MLHIIGDETYSITLHTSGYSQFRYSEVLAGTQAVFDLKYFRYWQMVAFSFLYTPGTASTQRFKVFNYSRYWQVVMSSFRSSGYSQVLIFNYTHMYWQVCSIV